MSPRRKIVPGEKPALAIPPPRRSWRWGLPLVATFSAAIAAVAITVSVLDLKSHERQRLTAIKNAAALSCVRSFMTEFTSPDPFHANDYTDHIRAQATGDFAEQYRNHENEILIHVAKAEPATGTVLDAGVSRQNDDGGIDVLVTTKLTAKSPDGHLQAERINRWVVTARQEGERWKISNVNPII